MDLRIRKGSVGKAVKVYLEQSSGNQHVGKTGLRWNSPASSVAYLRHSDTVPTLVPLRETQLGSYVAGGFCEVDCVAMPGLYEFGAPDGSLCPGADCVLFLLRFEGARARWVNVDLVDYDPHDGIGLGLAGFTRAVRHEHLTTIFRQVMPPVLNQMTQPDAN